MKTVNIHTNIDTPLSRIGVFIAAVCIIWYRPPREHNETPIKNLKLFFWAVFFLY